MLESALANRIHELSSSLSLALSVHFWCLGGAFSFCGFGAGAGLGALAFGAACGATCFCGCAALWLCGFGALALGALAFGAACGALCSFAVLWLGFGALSLGALAFGAVCGVLCGLAAPWLGFGALSLGALALGAACGVVLARGSLAGRVFSGRGAEVRVPGLAGLDLAPLGFPAEARASLGDMAGA